MFCLLIIKKKQTSKQIYTITVLNSSSGDQWLRKDITTTSDQPNGLDINLDTILSNYPYVKTECFSYEDSGFGTAESTKAEDISFQHPPTPQQLLQPQSTGVTTSTSVLLENNLSASSDLISYTDVSNNNNNEWNMDRNEIAKDWETCEANVSLKFVILDVYRNINLKNNKILLRNPLNHCCDQHSKAKAMERQCICRMA